MKKKGVCFFSPSHFHDRPQRSLAMREGKEGKKGGKKNKGEPAPVPFTINRRASIVLTDRCESTHRLHLGKGQGKREKKKKKRTAVNERASIAPTLKSPVRGTAQSPRSIEWGRKRQKREEKQREKEEKKGATCFILIS